MRSCKYGKFLSHVNYQLSRVPVGLVSQSFCVHINMNAAPGWEATADIFVIKHGVNVTFSGQFVLQSWMTPHK